MSYEIHICWSITASCFFPRESVRKAVEVLPLFLVKFFIVEETLFLEDFFSFLSTCHSAVEPYHFTRSARIFLPSKGNYTAGMCTVNNSAGISIQLCMFKFFEHYKQA